MLYYILKYSASVLLLIFSVIVWVWVMAVFSKLMVVLKYYIENSDKQSHENMLRLMKSLEYIFKFIIRSRILFAA